MFQQLIQFNTTPHYHGLLYSFAVIVTAFLGLLVIYFTRNKLAVRVPGTGSNSKQRTPETHIFTLPDERQVAYGIYGSHNADSTVFYFHGSPSSHHEAFLLCKSGRRCAIRIVAPSRPGSGGPTFREDGALLNYPDDILALVNHLNIRRFGIVAVSGGGPYAFACQQRIPRTRLVGLGIVAGIYPVFSLGTADIKLSSRLMLWAATLFPGAAAWLIDKQLGAVARDPDEMKLEALLLADMQQDSTTKADKEAWERAGPEIQKAVITGLREGVRYGGQGPAWEMKLLTAIGDSS